MSDDAILVEGVTKSFGKVQALAGIDLRVPRGTVLGLLGPNGAGKTTAVRVLTTLLLPDSGRALVEGRDVVADAPIVRRMIGLAGQYAAVDEVLTGRENVEMVGRLYHLPREEVRSRAEEVLARFALVDAADRPVKTYSGGMRRRLDLCASLVGRPAVLFLDEPTTGLDPRSRIEMWAVIRELVREGTTLLLTTQYLEEADNLADEIAVIDSGKVIASGTADELKARVGGDVVRFTVPDRAQLAAAAEAVGSLDGSAPSVDEATGAVTVTVGTGASTALIDAVRRLDAASITVSDLSLSRPSLDDVFLALTGHSAEDKAAEAAQPRGRGRRGRQPTTEEGS